MKKSLTINQAFMNKIKQETKIYSNILYIFEKVEQDKYFELIFQVFNKIFTEEMTFAYSGYIIRVV